MRVSSCALHYIPLPGSMGVPSLRHCYFWGHGLKSLGTSDLTLPCRDWKQNISTLSQQKINSPLVLVVFHSCRWSLAGSRKWWFMTRVPKRPDICPKTASFTFSWGSWRAPSTKSPCSLVRECVKHEYNNCVFLICLFCFSFFTRLILHSRQVCLSSTLLPDLSVAVISLFAQQMSLLSTTSVYFLSQVRLDAFIS